VEVSWALEIYVAEPRPWTVEVNLLNIFVAVDVSCDEDINPGNPNP
jgi:hypothetical protein